MTYRLDDRWIWDFWLASDDDHHHLFYLQAPRSIGDPEQRHWNVSIGHAISTDLFNWQTVEDAMYPGVAGGFDDYTVWTGSIERHADRWLMGYTGTSHAEGGLVQRIGFATSDDLFSWKRCDLPALSADPAHYETLADSQWHDEAWRDPWLFFDADDGHVHALFTARSREGERYDRGVIGHARSADLETWQQCAPLASPSGFGQMEVPQLVQIGDLWYLLFASCGPTQSAHRRSLGTGTGTYYMVSDSRYGHFEMIGDGVLEADEHGSTYAGRVHVCDGSPWFMAWSRTGPDGGFVGELAVPRPIAVRSDGSLYFERNSRTLTG